MLPESQQLAESWVGRIRLSRSFPYYGQTGSHGSFTAPLSQVVGQKPEHRANDLRLDFGVLDTVRYALKQHVLRNGLSESLDKNTNIVPMTCR